MLSGALVIAVYSWVLSAYWWYCIPNDLTNEPTGVVKMENSNGPRTEACGTPVVIVIVEERRPSINTNCDRTARYELSHCRIVSSKLNSFLERSRSRWWSRVLNAALFSSDSNTDGVLLSVVDSRSLMTLVIAVLGECSTRYADCRGAGLGELSVFLELCLCQSYE